MSVKFGKLHKVLLLVVIILCADKYFNFQLFNNSQNALIFYYMILLTGALILTNSLKETNQKPSFLTIDNNHIFKEKTHNFIYFKPKLNYNSNPKTHIKKDLQFKEMPEKPNDNQDILRMGMLSLAAKNCLNKSNAYLDEMFSAMDIIKSCSNEISKILNELDDIAFQTNIIALNTVKKCKEEFNAEEKVCTFSIACSETSRESGKLIKYSNENIYDGVKIISEVAGAFKGIVNGIDKIVSLLDKLNSNVQNKSEMTPVPKSNILHLSQPAQYDPEKMNEYTELCLEMCKEAQLIEGMLSRFKFLSLEEQKKRMKIESEH